MSYIYLASPYTDPSPTMQESRYILACNACALLARERIPVYAPIVHWREVSILWALPGDSDMWWDQNRVMIDHCAQMWVYTLPGWDRSKGVLQEVDYAKACNIQVFRAPVIETLIEFYKSKL